MKRHTIYLLLLLQVVFVNAFFAQTKGTEEYIFRTFSPKGGFFYDGINSIQQDKDGFVWILANNTLLRFDGYERKQYFTHFNSLDPEKKWDINDISLNGEGLLVVATNNGLFNYNRLVDSFEQIIEANLWYVRIDYKNNIWVKDSNKLALFDTKSKSLVYPLYKGKPLNNIRSTYSDQYGFLASAFSNKIYKLDYNSMQFDLLYSFPNGSSIVDIKRNGQKLWVLVDYLGLYKLDLQSLTIDEFYDFYTLHNKDKSPLNSLLVDKKGNVWVGSQGGLYILDTETKKSTLHVHSDNKTFSLPNSSVWTIKEDNRRNIWLGTYSGGICYVNLDEKKQFESYSTLEGQLNHPVVSSFSENEESIWIATEGGGLNKMNKKNGQFTYLRHKPQSNSLSYDHVKSLSIDKDQKLWIAMFRGGLNCLDTKTMKFEYFKHEPGNKNSLLSNNLRKIIIEPDGSGLWIAYQKQELVVSFYSFEKKQFEHYYFDKEDSGYYIFDIYRGRNDQLWIISHKSLYLMDIKNHTVNNMLQNEDFYLNAQTIYMDGNDNLWIGTLGNGLLCFNTHLSKLAVLNKILEYKVSDIYSLLTDDEGSLWIGTNNGLFKYNINDGELSQFDDRDGTQGQVYYALSVMKSKSGNLYFGGTNGFTVITPRTVLPNSHKPKAMISDFFVDNIPVKLSEVNNETSGNEIVLSYNKINFGFRFSSDNFLIPEKNRFKYRLKGYDERWVEVDATERSALFTKVPAGNYTFEVMAANNDGVWSDSITSINIQRIEAPWSSWWAYLTYFMFFAGVLFCILKYYHRHKSLKLQLHLDYLDKMKKEEIQQAQLRFFTNISHDFRTPLSLIIAGLERLRQDGMKEYYYRILNGNAKRLLNLVNELMDFRTIENGKMKLSIESTDINSFIKKMAYDFHDYAIQRKIHFDTLCDPQLDAVLYIDRQILEKILMNLLNNAFKYTKDKGNILIKTFADASLYKSRYKYSCVVNEIDIADCFALVIEDTGVGISKESIKDVFERYYTLNTVNPDAHLGTGLGLALVKSLVLLHRGSVTIFSERDKGTDIIISFPKDIDVYDKSEFKSNEDSFPQRFTHESEETTESEGIIENVLSKNKRKILLVEDNEDLKYIISDFLSEDFQIFALSDGMEASSFLQSNEVDLIISDIMMPHKDGIALCKEVKSDVNTSHIPFILLTAKTGEESKFEGADSGADLYIEKPIDINLLRLMINNIFTRQAKLWEYYSKNFVVENIETSTNEQDSKFLKRLLEILDSNLDKPKLSVNYIAAELSMSRSKLYTKIKSMTGISIVEFITTYRVRKAALLILEQNLSMRDILDAVGIESQSYFARVFKKEFGCSPSQYLTTNKNNPSLE